MNKYLKITLLIFLIFSLAGCNEKQQGDETSDNQQGQIQDGYKDSEEQNQTQTDSVMQTDILLHLEINPSFDIHVDNGGVIVGVDCLNSDAEDVIKNVNIANLEFVNGVSQLLKAVYDKGLLKSDSIISLSLKVDASVTYDIFKATDKLISDFTQNVIDVSFETNTEIVGNTEVAGNPQQGNSEDERPAHLIDEYGTEFYYTYYANGVLKTEERKFVEDGFNVQSITEFDSSGTILSESTYKEDGYHHERIFDGGVLSKEYMHIPHDGGHDITRTYHSNGKVAEEIDYHIHTSQEFVFRYDENGKQTEYIGFDNNGKPVHIVY